MFKYKFRYTIDRFSIWYRDLVCIRMVFACYLIWSYFAMFSKAHTNREGYKNGERTRLSTLMIFKSCK